MFDKILVAIDESEHAQPVLVKATELASKFGSELQVLHVLETGFVGKAGVINMGSSEDAHRLVNDATAKLVAEGLTASAVVRAGLHGRLAVEIDAQARTFGASLIILGTRGLTDLEGLVMGSTTHRLLHVTEIPVLVIP